MSFSRLVNALKDGLAAPREAEPQRRHDPLRLATAAVLLEVAHADGSFHPAEDGNMGEFLTRAFSLSDDETRELVEEAEEIRSNAIDHFAVTNYIRQNLSLDERIDIVRTMWRIVYADGHLTGYETYLVRKIADLLGIEHHVMIEAKVGVLDEMRR